MPDVNVVAPLPAVRRLGAHLPLGAGMVKAVERARDIGANTLQVFSDNPSAWRRRTEPPAELPAFRHALDAGDVRPLAVHAMYLINLASPDEELWRRSVETLGAELRAGAVYGAAYVNVHLGSHRGSGSEAGIRRIGRGVADALAEAPADPDAPILVLENSAGGGDGLGGTVDELEAILEALAANGADPARVALCLDTAHAWGAGYEISRPDRGDLLLEAIETALGRGRIAMVHFNDSMAALGSHADRHQHIGAGEIGPIGLGHLLRHPLLSVVPFYLETPGMDEGYDAVDMERVRLLLEGQPLPDLPPEARKLPGTRARASRRRT